jgi:hypothetical protein
VSRDTQQSRVARRASVVALTSTKSAYVMCGLEVIERTKKRMSAAETSGTRSQSSAPYTSASESSPFWSASNLVKASWRSSPRARIASRTRTA